MLEKGKKELIARNLRYILSDLDDPSIDEEVLLDDAKILQTCSEILQRAAD